jgi:3D (Asp-Asp-Asp) domain-containing protein
MGKFKTTYYCDEEHKHICGIGERITASGKPTVVGKTVAVDRKVIPLGSKVYIAGIGWRSADDTGGAIKGNKIDVLVENHDEAMDTGVTHNDVWVLVKKS